MTVANTRGEPALKKSQWFLESQPQCGLLGKGVCICLCILVVLRSSEGCSLHGNPGVDRKEKNGVTAQTTPFLPLPKGSTNSQCHASLGCGGGRTNLQQGDLQGTPVQTVAPTLGSRQSGHRCYRRTLDLAILKKHCLLPGMVPVHTRWSVQRPLEHFPRLTNDFQLCMLPASASGRS